MENFDSINLLRVVATLIVFFLHTMIFAGNQVITDYWWAFVFHTPAWAGCWIFFVISGYLAGLSFKNNRYSLDFIGIKTYFLKKIKNVWFPTMAFIILVAVLSFPAFFVDNPKEIVHLFTCWYNGSPGVDGIGATWFVFTLMWLYLLTPLFCLCINRLTQNQQKLLILMVTICGLLYRFLLRKLEMDWYVWGYTSFLVNIDLYFGGILFSYIKEENHTNKEGMKFANYKFLFILSSVSLVVLILINSYLYSHNRLHFYRYYAPTVYLILVGFYLNFSCDNEISFLSMKYISSRCCSLFNIFINWFAAISFEFYLFHSLVLNRITSFILIENSLFRYLIHVIIAALITTIFSIGFHRIFQRKGNRVERWI